MMIDITISLNEQLKNEIELFFKSKGIELNTGLTHIITDFLMKSQTKILVEKMDEYRLSPREKELVKYICQGKQVKEIADIMCISIHTVRNHYRHLYKKCNVQNRIELFLKLTGLIF